MQTNTDINAEQLADGFRRYPIDDHGKMRYMYGKVTASADLADGGTMGLFWLPPGRKRVLPHLSRIKVSAFGAGRTLDIGHASYRSRPVGNPAVADDPDFFVNGQDVSAGISANVFSTSLKLDMYSLNEVLVYATVLGGTMPQDATLEVLLAYLYE